jgi:sugar lactone lactonase YvrE
LPPTRDTFSSVYGITVDSTGRLYVVDREGQRIISFPAGSTIADRVFGQQGSFTGNSVNNPNVASGFNYPNAVAVDASNNLFVVDYFNARVLFFPYSTLASSTSAYPTGLYGQSRFDTVQSNAIGADSIGGPERTAVDASGNLYIADTGNNRVLYFAASSTTTQSPTGRPSAASRVDFFAIILILMILFL